MPGILLIIKCNIYWVHNYLHSTDGETEEQRGVTVVNVVDWFPVLRELIF